MQRMDSRISQITLWDLYTQMKNNFGYIEVTYRKKEKRHTIKTELYTFRRVINTAINFIKTILLY